MDNLVKTSFTLYPQWIKKNCLKKKFKQKMREEM